MATLADFIDTNGRANYRGLVNLVRETSLPVFVNQAKHPFLVGKQLYEGHLWRPQGCAASATMRFSREEFKMSVDEASGKIDVDSPSVGKAVFALCKKLDSETPPNVFSIGRFQTNDMVIADYAISKNHASVIVFFKKYFLVDLDSTNGTAVNGQRLQPNVKVEIPVGCTITFGRFDFVLVPADALHSRLLRLL